MKGLSSSSSSSVLGSLKQIHEKRASESDSDRLGILAILSIEKKEAKKLDVKNLIDTFAQKKDRKIPL